MYRRHFELSEFPFNLTPDPRFFYANRTYQEAFTGVRYGIKLRHGLIVLIGETGTGKTSLVRFVKERATRAMQVVALAHPPDDSTELLRLVTEAAGLPTGERDGMIERLRSYAAEQMDQERVFAVLLDEAQDLSRETLAELATLSQLQHREQKLLQIVLVGRPELEGKLRTPELENLVGVWCRLEPLRPDEVKTYIDRRLSSAGYRGNGLFETAAVDQIAAYSKGIPAIINVLCDNALFTAYTERRASVSVDAIHKAHHTMRFGEEREATPASARTPSSAQTPQREFQPPQPEPTHRPAPDRRHTPRSRQPARAERSRKFLSPSTAAAAAGIVLLIASAAMLYTEPKRVPPARVYEPRPVPAQPAGPRGASAPGSAAAPAIAEERPKLQVVTTRPRPVTTREEGAAAVYVHMSEERDHSVAEEIGDALRDSGYFVSSTRMARGRTQGDVRFFYRQDRVEAERIRSVIEAELASRGYPLSLKLLERDGGKFEFAAPGKIEVWLPPLRSSRS